MKNLTFIVLFVASLSLWLAFGCGGSSSPSNTQTVNTNRLAVSTTTYVDPNSHRLVTVVDPDTTRFTTTTDAEAGNHTYVPSPAPTIKPFQPKLGLKEGDTYVYPPNDPYADRNYRESKWDQLLDDLTLQDPIYVFQPADGSKNPAWPSIRMNGNDGTRSGLLHILDEHHPKYWYGDPGNKVDKPTNGFFDSDMTPEDILAYIKEYIKKYKERNPPGNVMKPPFGPYPPIKIGGAFYVLVIDYDGTVKTFYPVKSPS